MTAAKRTNGPKKPPEQSEVQPDNPKKKDGRAKTSPLNGAKGGRPRLPPFTETGVRFTDEMFHDQTTNRRTLIHWRKTWWRYEHPKGWREYPEGELRKVVVTWLESSEAFGSTIGAEYLSNFLLHLSGFNLCGVSDLNEPPVWVESGKSAKNWMCFDNGLSVNVWDLAAKGSKPVETVPDLFTRDVVNYPFDPKAKCPMFHGYLKTSLPSQESRDTVQAMLGLCLADTTKYETFFYLYGPTARNGKTVLLHILEALVGKHNVSYVGLHNLAERFETWPLAESKVNIHGDMRTDIGVGTYTHIEGVFKDFVSGGALEYQKKGQDKFSAACRARFVFAGNSLPTFVDRSDAIWERLRVVFFPHQIPAHKRDPNLAYKIIDKELSGVFNWAMEGLARIIKDGRVMDSEEGKRVKEEHKFSCDREAVFLRESGYVKGSPEDSVSQRDMYDSYKKWMSKNGYKWLGAEKFYSRVENILPGAKVVQAKRRGLRGETLRVREFRGIKVEC